MTRFKSTLVAIALFVGFFVRADEGMWFLMFIERLNHRDMQKMGLQLTTEEIYSINNSSLKDAVVQFNGGCTAELISKEGLLLTNHHCGYDAIAELSTPEKDYLTNGFWAATKKDELKPKSLYVRFFVRMDDCTKRIMAKLNDGMTEAERDKAIKEESTAIEKENSENGKYTVSVRSFFQGNEFYYFVYQDYKDVRLVGTPPENIGKFGGDTDNWEWPRHTGDFSMFRVYGDTNGNPAEYSTSNVPLKPKHHLPVNIKGVKEGDFAMILGYPGRTNRWLPAGGIEQNVKYAYPAWVEASKTSMDAMQKYMAKDDAVRLNYASKYAGIANYWKNRQGMIDALTKFGTATSKAANEVKFNAWANKKENKEKYGSVVATINNYYAATNDKSRHDNYLQIMFRGSEYAKIARTLGPQLEAYAKADEATKAQMLPDLKAGIEEFFAGIYIPAERDIMVDGLNLYAKKAGYKLVPSIETAFKKGNGDMKNFVTALFEMSILTSKEKMMAFLEVPSEGLIANDPLMKLSNEMIAHLNTRTDELTKLQNDFGKAYRLLVDGMRQSNLSPVKYPDANSTLRLTYGKVSALPADKRNDAKINNYTTLQGTINKYKPNDKEFDLPKRLIELNNTKDFGEYADKAGYMPVNFLTNNDITGGNSGSPVLNGKGELIGLAFDGNIEAMAGDVIFDAKLQKTINVDIRYVLFIIDKYAGAKHIVNEMTIIR
ncbi:MAG: S46 family peptidase [Flavobacteriales bacterium]|nr:S46 family peptidase [Flavobacteriales bacterium]